MIQDHPKVKYGKTGVLLINLGTPDSYKWWDIRKYLKEFLSDRRVIETNKILWFFLLNVIILNFRPHKTAKNYKKIWFEKDNISPLRFYTRLQRDKLKNIVRKKNVYIDYAMRYGQPAIQSQMQKLQDAGCNKIVVMPLYPQYAASTTATVNDEVFKWALELRWQPAIRTVPPWHDCKSYIKAFLYFRLYFFCKLIF